MWYYWNGKSESSFFTSFLFLSFAGFIFGLGDGISWVSWICYGLAIFCLLVWIDQIITSIRNYFKYRKDIKIRLENIRKQERLSQGLTYDKIIRK